MIDRFLKDKEVTIHDSLLGTYHVPYQDNIGDIVALDNDIDLLNEALREIEQKGSFKYAIINFLKSLTYVYGSFYAAALFSISNISFFQEFFPFIFLAFEMTCFYNSKKSYEGKRDGVNLQKAYILDEIAKKRSEIELLKRNKSTTNIVKEEIITLDIIAKRRALLQEKLDLLMSYKMHQRYYQKNFDKQTLGEVLPREDEKRLIQNVIMRERRR